ncbi:DUF1398 domain-containing protein [bacterium]|nr:DUF1398 domain-containing protein [bacterium]
MDAERIAIAETCLHAAHDGSMSFPQIVGTLMAAGFEGYVVDFRRSAQIFYLTEGDCIDLPLPEGAGPIAAAFDSVEIEHLVRWAQANPPGYSYAAFTQAARAAGCAGYHVSFSGRRVVYFGRTAATHVEHFPG